MSNRELSRAEIVAGLPPDLRAAGPGLLPLRAGLAHRGGQGIAAAARGGEIV